MALTLAKALLELPILSKAKVVAGEEGLDREIHWTHIIDHPDVLPWAEQGNLLLTTAFSLTLHPDIQVDLIPQLADKGVAGLVINIGRYMGKIPKVMIKAANERKFPIISLPWEVDFVQVTHAIHERIIGDQYLINEKLFNIHKVLTQVVLDGGGLPELANTLASLITHSITIEDSSLNLLAYTTRETIDEAREDSIHRGRTPDALKYYLTQQGFFHRFKSDPSPQHIPPTPEYGITLDRIVAPIKYSDHIYGYIWIIATAHSLSELDFLAVQQGANIAALIMSREQAIYAAEQRSKVHLLERLLESHEKDAAQEIAERLYGFGIRDRYQILVFEEDELSYPRIQSVIQLIENFFRSEGLHALTSQWGDRIVAVLGVDSHIDVYQLADQLHGSTAEKGFNLNIGMSAQATETMALRTLYQQALDALRFGKVLRGKEGGVADIENLGYIIDVIKLSKERTHNNKYREAALKIQNCDRTDHTDLIKTLYSFLTYRLDVQQTSQSLHIHRNTLYQRLDKIQTITGLDLNDMFTLVNLYFALLELGLQNTK